ncbi:4'-phosphopantetheinyl transferase family protein [Thermogemmatispora sp.]|uniref:4'-phosphopantetheinyl transferase family protein n=1 Tax=Thermogemmatispora sp. TaxID=1968838 RepID=UPI0035E4339A
MSSVLTWQDWPTRPTDFYLAPGEVHLWCTSLALPSATVARLAAVLAPDEQQRAAGFLSAESRREFVAARAILRLILSRYLGLGPQELRLRTNPWGKPELEPAPASSRPALTFNLSHSEGLALYALTCERAIGVDLEFLRPLPEDELEQLAARYFAPSEYRTFLNLAHEEKRAAFFRCWTRKEAYVKARGQGLSLSLSAFEVSLTSDSPPRLLASSEDPQAPQRWSLLSLEPSPSYTAALAVEGHIDHVEYLRWNSHEFSPFAT